MTVRTILSLVCALASSTATFAAAQQTADSVAPEGTTAQIAFAQSNAPRVQDALRTKTAGQPVHAKNWMIVAANPLASEAGAKVLERGGSAAAARRMQ